MITVVDQIGQSHTFKNTPQRIVSLVPSQTELLVDIGLIDAIQGVTKFCVHPEGLRKKKTVVGGTKQVAIEKIKALAPDIILCNKEENTKEIVTSLSQIAPVHVSDVKTMADAYGLIEQYGTLFNVSAVTEELIVTIKKRAASFKESQLVNATKRCMYLIWRDPYMAVGRGTFIDHLLSLNGFENHIQEERYPEVTLKSFEEVDYVLLSSEPFPFAEKHRKEFQKFTNAKVILVDGEYFSWYGSRLLKAFDYFKNLQIQLAR